MGQVFQPRTYAKRHRTVRDPLLAVDGGAAVSRFSGIYVECVEPPRPRSALGGFQVVGGPQVVVETSRVEDLNLIDAIGKFPFAVDLVLK